MRWRWRWRRAAPTGASPSKAWRGSTIWASCRCRTSTTILRCRRRGSTAHPCRASAACSGRPSCGRRWPASGSASENDRPRVCLGHQSDVPRPARRWSGQQGSANLLREAPRWAASSNSPGQPQVPRRGTPMKLPMDRRTFLNSLGVTAGAAVAASAMSSTYFAGPRPAHAAAPKVKGNVPDKPYKTGHITFLTGPANLLGEPGRKGHLLAAEEINAEGGLLGKRKIETIFADEAAGTDANVRELRRMKLSENIDLFTGVISSGNTPALGPVAEELQVLTMFNDGCTDFLFDKAVPNPK